MKNIKLFVYGLLCDYHDWMCDQYNIWIEDADAAGDHKGMVKCCELYSKHYAKCEKYYAKMKEIRDQKEGA